MKRSLTIILLLFFSVVLFGQHKQSQKKSKPDSDKGYKVIKLNKIILSDKVVVVEVGKKATIFMDLNHLVTGANKFFTKGTDPFFKVIHFLDSASLKRDTVFINNLDSFLEIKILVYLQLKSGNVKVFYKRQKSFVTTIFSGSEMYGNDIDKFFFLPDKRPFFGFRWVSDLMNPNYEENKKNETTSKKDEESRFKSILEE